VSPSADGTQLVYESKETHSIQNFCIEFMLSFDAKSVENASFFLY